jgi:hypothetical protein
MEDSEANLPEHLTRSEWATALIEKSRRYRVAMAIAALEQSQLGELCSDARRAGELTRGEIDALINMKGPGDT